MKRVNKQVMVPPLLGAYTLESPGNDWEQLKGNNDPAYQEIKTQLIADQHGLCCYCENTMLLFDGQGLDDFRVEHFHPKRPHVPPPNHALNWSNMLGSCSGGNVRGIGDSSRFTSPDHSCDVPKDSKNLTNVILDPQTDIPLFPRLFDFKEDGSMHVSAQCPPPLQAKAQASIDELRLSPQPTKKVPVPRLCRFRKTVIDQLEVNVDELIQQGKTIGEAYTELAQTHLNNPAPNWSAFFTCIRWFLGGAAEDQLHAIGFSG